MCTNGEQLYPTAAMVTNAQTAWQALYPGEEETSSARASAPSAHLSRSLMDTGEEVPQFETMQDFMAWAQTDPNQMRVRPGANNLPEGQPASALHWYERTGGGVLDGGSAFSPDAQAPQSRQQAPVTAAADPVSTDSPSFGESAGAEAARRNLSESLSEPPCRRARAGVRGAHNGSLGKAGRRDPLGCETGKAAPPAPLMEAQPPRSRDQLGRASVGLGLGGGVCPRGEPRRLDEQQQQRHPLSLDAALGGPHSAALAERRASRRVPAALPQHAALTAPGRQPGGRRRREVAAHLTSFGGPGAAGFRPLCDCSLRRLWHRVAHRAADGECSPALPPTPPPGRGSASGACCTPG